MATELVSPVTSNHYAFNILRMIYNHKFNIGTNILTNYYFLLFPIKFMDRNTLSQRSSSAFNLDSLILLSIIRYFIFWTNLSLHCPNYTPTSPLTVEPLLPPLKTYLSNQPSPPFSTSCIFFLSLLLCKYIPVHHDRVYHTVKLHLIPQ